MARRSVRVSPGLVAGQAPRRVHKTARHPQDKWKGNNLAVQDFETPVLWRQDLDARWPERLVMKEHLLKLLNQTLSSASSPEILELGVGDGELLSALLGLLPDAHLVAMDNNQTLLDHCIAQTDSPRVSTVLQDLTSPWAGPHAGAFDAVYTLQSLHDLGDLRVLRSTYSEIATVLKPGGVLVNADFVVPLPQDVGAAPRRFPVSEHLRILKALGFHQCGIVHEQGLLGCVVATQPG